MSNERAKFIALICIAKNPTRDYPFAVIPSRNGVERQELLCRNLRDSLIAANAMCQAAYAVDPMIQTDIVWTDQLVKPI